MGELEAARIGFHQSVTESIDTTMLGGEMLFHSPVPVGGRVSPTVRSM
jgi:hypothetical protein